MEQEESSDNRPISIAELTGSPHYAPRRSAAEEAAKPLSRPVRGYVHQATRQRDLTPAERRAALMYVAGASKASIALELECDQEHVQNIFERPHVAKTVTKLQAQFATDAAPVIRDLNAEIEAVAADAFDRLRRNMEILDDVGDARLQEGDYKNGLRAKLGCVSTTQDILDRAGKRAPTRTVGAMLHVIAPEQLEKLERIISDRQAADSDLPERSEGSPQHEPTGPPASAKASIALESRGDPRVPWDAARGPTDAPISHRRSAEPCPRAPEPPAIGGGSAIAEPPRRDLEDEEGSFTYGGDR